MRFAVLLVISWLLLFAADDYTERRERLTRLIDAAGVDDPAVLRVMRETPRHEFVPEAVRTQAYEDRPLPIGLGQTISQPSLVGFMTESLQLRKEHRVLEIGTGSGYQAAVLSPSVREVFTIEIVPALAKVRRCDPYAARLSKRSVSGRRRVGWPEHAPFDRIILTAAPPELPDALVRQLAPSGRLIAPVGRTGSDQELLLIEKAKDGSVTKKSLLAVRFVPMVRKPVNP